MSCSEIDFSLDSSPRFSCIPIYSRGENKSSNIRVVVLEILNRVISHPECPREQYLKHLCFALHFQLPLLSVEYQHAEKRGKYNTHAISFLHTPLRRTILFNSGEERFVSTPRPHQPTFKPSSVGKIHPPLYFQFYVFLPFFLLRFQEDFIDIQLNCWGEKRNYASKSKK